MTTDNPTPFGIYKKHLEVILKIGNSIHIPDAAHQSELITRSMMFHFADWLQLNYHCHDDKWWGRENNIWYSTLELLDLFLQSLTQTTPESK